MDEATGEEEEVEVILEVSMRREKLINKGSTELKIKATLLASHVTSSTIMPPSALMRSLNYKKQ